MMLSSELHLEPSEPPITSPLITTTAAVTEANPKNGNSGNFAGIPGKFAKLLEKSPNMEISRKLEKSRNSLEKSPNKGKTAIVQIRQKR